MQEKSTGTVLWFNDKLGYGYIQDDRGDTLFIHFKNIKEKGFKRLFRGQAVRYEILKTDMGLQAVKLKYIKASI